MVLDIDRLAGRVDGEQVLVKDRPFTVNDVVWSAAGTRMPVRVAPSVNIPLDLDDASATRIRWTCRKGKLVISIVAPPAIIKRPLAGLIPPLDKVVVHVGR